MDVCVFIEGHFTWKIGSLVTAGKVENSLVTAGGRPGCGREQCLGIVVKLPCSAAVTDRATGVRRCLGDWTSRDMGQNPEIAHFDETTVKFVVVQTFW